MRREGERNSVKNTDTDRCRARERDPKRKSEKCIETNKETADNERQRQHRHTKRHRRVRSPALQGWLPERSRSWLGWEGGRGIPKKVSVRWRCGE